MQLVFTVDAKDGMIVAEDIFAPGAGGNALVRAGTILTPSLIEHIDKCGVSFFQVDGQAETPVPTPPAAAPDLFFPISKPKPRHILDPALRNEAVASLEDFFSAIAVNSNDIHAASKIVRHLDKVIENLVDTLTADNRALVNIGDLKSYDEYTYHHSLSVAVLTIAIAQSCGFDKHRLSRIAKSAMMHDIGKTAVPIGIIRKPSRLDEDEFNIIKTHPREGYDYLSKTMIGDTEIRKAVLHHHEKFDGTGYPDGLKGENIPLWSRIIAVADVYDALTSARPYREPMQPYEAVEYIMGGVGSFFDYNIVLTFAKRLEPYPVGRIVELSDGRFAVVLRVEYPMRPVIMLAQTGEILDLFNDRRYLNLVINKLMPE